VGGTAGGGGAAHRGSEEGRLDQVCGVGVTVTSPAKPGYHSGGRWWRIRRRKPPEMERVGGAGARLTGDEEEDGNIPDEAGLARRWPKMVDPATEATKDGAGGRGGGVAR
jgi:hypothetical protein